MIRRYAFPFLALAGAIVAVFTVLSESEPTEGSRPPAVSPGAERDLPLKGVGIIEASTRNIAVGAAVPGIVMRVAVTVGDRVKAGDVLFVVDDRAARAALDVRRQELAVAEQTLARLEKMPRAEEVASAEAKVAQMQAQLGGAQAQLEMAESAGATLSKREVSKREHAVQEAQARLAQAQAELELVKMGAWSADVAVARAKVDLARAQVHAAEVNLALTTVSSPVDGEVLQVNIRVGEYAENGPLATPLMIMGDTRTLHVRANIDEYDAWRVRPEAPARAALRGNPDLKADLTFVRIEPYIIPKKSLTGYAPERVDTRVLQVIYAFPGDALPVHVGQMVDVFIEPAGSARVEPNE